MSGHFLFLKFGHWVRLIVAAVAGGLAVYAAAVVGHSHTATVVGMTLEEALAEIERQKTTITNLEQQIASADPEGDRARADGLLAQIATLTKDKEALAGNNANLVKEKDAEAAKAGKHLLRIKELEKQLEGAADGIDVAKIKQDAAEAAAQETGQLKDAEYKSIVEERDLLKAENEQFKAREQQSHLHSFLIKGLRAIKSDPAFDDIFIQRAESNFVKSSTGDYIIKGPDGNPRTGRDGLITAEEYFETEVDGRFRLNPKGGGAGGGSLNPKPKEEFTPGRRHKMKLERSGKADEAARLYGPGGQFAHTIKQT